MLYMIRKKDEQKYLSTDIDSSGMSVFWTSILRGDRMSKDQAESFLARLKERYPNEKFELLPESL